MNRDIITDVYESLTLPCIQYHLMNFGYARRSLSALKLISMYLLFFLINLILGLPPNRTYRMIIAFLITFFSAISLFGFLDFAPTIIFSSPEATRLQLTGIDLSSASITTETKIVQGESHNTDVVITSKGTSLIKPESAGVLWTLCYSSALLAYSTDRIYDFINGILNQETNSILEDKFEILLIGLFSFILTGSWFYLVWDSIVKLENGGRDGIIGWAKFGIIGYIVLISILLVLMLLPAIPDNLRTSMQVDRYLQNLSRFVYGILTIGISGSVGGLLSIAISRSITPRPFVLLSLVGIVLFPIFGVVIMMYYKMYCVERKFRGTVHMLEVSK